MMENEIKSSQAHVMYSITAADMAAYGEMQKEEGRREALDQKAAEKEYPTISRREALRMLGISEATIISWHARGLLRMSRRGHACFYFPSDIDRILIYGTDGTDTVK